MSRPFAVESLEPRTLLAAAGSLVDFATVHATSNFYSEIQVGDLDGDGLNDVAGIGFGAPTINVLRNVGDGRLGLETTPVNLGGAAVAQTNTLRMSDLDADGDNDLIVADALTSTLYVLRNSGGGQVFTLSTFADANPGVGISDLEIGDVNGDGNLDAVASEPFNGGRVAIFLGDGAGAFAQPVYVATAIAGSMVDLADLDGDGRLDLLVSGNGPSQIDVHRGVNSPAFFAGTPQTFATTASVTDFTVLDFDGDGDQDVAAATNAGIELLTNTSTSGTISFTTAAPTQVQGGFVVTPGDIDGDGDEDLLAGPTVLHMNAGAIESATFDPNFSTFNAGRLADMDGDGDLEILGIASRSPGVMIVENLGGGAYHGLPTQFGGGSADVAVGDLDGDGDLDAVTVVNGANTVSIQMNLGGGRFAIPTTLVVSPGFSGGEVELTDIDADGDVDIIATDNLTSVVSVLRNSGTGAVFTTASFSAAVPGPGISDFVVGDANGDGNLDVLAVEPQNNVTLVFLGDGAGAFAQPVAFAAGLAPTSLLFVDVDGDGRRDLVTAHSGAASVGIRLGVAGPGMFGATVTTIAAGVAPSRLAAADVDNDGALDLGLTDVGSNNVSILRNSSAVGAPAFSQIDLVNIQNTSFGIDAGDIDGDGFADFTVGIGGAASAVLRGGANGIAAVDISSPNPVTRPVLADLDGDGDLDQIGSDNFGGGLVVNLNLDGAFMGAPRISASTGNTPRAIATGDLDGDGMSDLVSISAFSNTATVQFGLPGGAFGPAVANITLNAGFTAGFGVEIADVDSDGDNDIIIVDSASNTLLVARNSGQGLVYTLGTTTDGNVNGFTDMAIGDVNGDGRLDVVATETNFVRVAVFLGAGDGTFAQPTYVNSSSNPVGIELVDLDGDGALDLVAGDQFANTVNVFRNVGGPGIFGAVQPISAGVAILSDVKAVDMNGDGFRDLVLADEAGVQLSVLNNTSTPGNITFGAGTPVTLAFTPQRLAVGDLDNDGDEDLFVGANSNFFNPVAAIVLVGPSGAESVQKFQNFIAEDASLVDLDGDNDLDIVSANRMFNPFGVQVTMNATNGGNNSTNQAPTINPTLSIAGPAVTGQTFDLTWGMLSGSASDADGDPISFVVKAVLGGTFTKNGNPVVPGTTTIAQGEKLVWTPGASTGSVQALRVAATDGSTESSSTMDVSVTVNAANSAPTIATNVFLQEAATGGKALTISYANLAGVANANDPDGDAITFVVQSVLSGTLTKNGNAVQPGVTTIAQGESLAWTPAANATGTVAAFSMKASDGTLTSNATATVRLSVESQAQAKIRVGDGRDIQQGYTSTGGLVAATINDDGELVIFDRSDDESVWSSFNMGSFNVTDDPIVVTTARNFRTYVALPASDGLRLFEKTGAQWQLLDNLTSTTGGDNITRAVTSMVTIEGLAIITGLTQSGDVVIYIEDASGTWNAQNLSDEDLAGNGLSTPNFQGDLVAYVMPWNGLNIAGLDAQGRIHSVWWSPGLASWTTSDLSADTGTNIRFTGGLSVYVTSWGGTNITGIDNSGDLGVVWWSPGLANWNNTNFTDELFDGSVTLKSVSVNSFTTPWDSLHIVGVDGDGVLRVFWWDLSNPVWQTADFTEVLPTSDPVDASTVSTAVGQNGQQSIVAASPADDALAFSWAIGRDWDFTNLTSTLL